MSAVKAELSILACPFNCFMSLGSQGVYTMGEGRSIPGGFGSSGPYISICGFNTLIKDTLVVF